MYSGIVRLKPPINPKTRPMICSHDGVYLLTIDSTITTRITWELIRAVTGPTGAPVVMAEIANMHPSRLSKLAKKPVTQSSNTNSV